jgi:hypothetical protein
MALGGECADDAGNLRWKFDHWKVTPRHRLVHDRPRVVQCVVILQRQIGRIVGLRSHVQCRQRLVQACHCEQRVAVRCVATSDFRPGAQSYASAEVFRTERPAKDLGRPAARGPPASQRIRYRCELHSGGVGEFAKPGPRFGMPDCRRSRQAAAARQRRFRRTKHARSREQLPLAIVRGRRSAESGADCRIRIQAFPAIFLPKVRIMRDCRIAACGPHHMIRRAAACSVMAGSGSCIGEPAGSRGEPRMVAREQLSELLVPVGGERPSAAIRVRSQYSPYRPCTESSSFFVSYPTPSLKTISTFSMSEI